MIFTAIERIQASFPKTPEMAMIIILHLQERVHNDIVIFYPFLLACLLILCFSTLKLPPLSPHERIVSIWIPDTKSQKLLTLLESPGNMQPVNYYVGSRNVLVSQSVKPRNNQSPDDSVPRVQFAILLDGVVIKSNIWTGFESQPTPNPQRRPFETKIGYHHVQGGPDASGSNAGNHQPFQFHSVSHTCRPR